MVSYGSLLLFEINGSKSKNNQTVHLTHDLFQFKFVYFSLIKRL